MRTLIKACDISLLSQNDLSNIDHNARVHLELVPGKVGCLSGATL
jgi:hypothetical protein